MSEAPFNLGKARAHVMQLCVERRPEAALYFAQRAKGSSFETEQLLALTELYAGEQLRERGLGRRGIARFEALEAGLNRQPLAYDRANGYSARWGRSRHQLGVSQAL